MEPPSPGRPRSSDVDARIVEATRTLLDTKGVDAVTIASVAAEAGVGRPTVYRRFDDRDAMVRGVLVKDLEAVEASVRVPEGPVEDQVFALLEPYVDYYGAHPARARALLGASLLNNEGREGALNRLNLARAARMADLLASARERGALSPALDIEVATSVVLSAYLTGVLGLLNGVLPSVGAQKGVLRRVITQHLRR